MANNSTLCNVASTPSKGESRKHTLSNWIALKTVADIIDDAKRWATRQLRIATAFRGIAGNHFSIAKIVLFRLKFLCNNERMYSVPQDWPSVTKTCCPRRSTASTQPRHQRLNLTVCNADLRWLTQNRLYAWRWMASRHVHVEIALYSRTCREIWKLARLHSCTPPPTMA